MPDCVVAEGAYRELAVRELFAELLSYRWVAGVSNAAAGDPAHRLGELPDPRVCEHPLQLLLSRLRSSPPRRLPGRLLVVPVPFEQAGEIAASIGLQAALDHVGSSPSPPGWDSEEKSRELEVQFAPPFEFQLVCVGSYGRIVHMLQDLSHGVKDLALHV